MFRSLVVRLTVAVCGALLVLSACGSPEGGGTDQAGSSRRPSSFNTPFSDDRAYPVLVSSQLAVGENRLVIGLLNNHDAPIASPRTSMRLALFDLAKSESEPVSHTAMDFVWIDKPYNGVYVGRARFGSTGKWGAEVRLSGKVEATTRMNFQVLKDSSTPDIGERVPASRTPTLDDVKNVSEISTDAHPDPRFYQESVAEAVKGHDPFVLVFATPKFCQSKVCGPTLDITKKVSRSFPGITFIHVEVYTNLDDPSNLRPVPSTREWGLPSEPWVFVVDSRGRLAAKYEGIISAPELRSALRSLH